MVTELINRYNTIAEFFDEKNQEYDDKLFSRLIVALWEKESTEDKLEEDSFYLCREHELFQIAFTCLKTRVVSQLILAEEKNMKNSCRRILI